MEDLGRRLKSPASVSLLHGPAGIGKTRLLEQLVQNRLASKNVIFIRFNAGNSFVLNDAVFTNGTFQEQVISTLKQNEIILLDQFDHAPQEIQQLIFKFWGSEAAAQGLNLVLSVNTDSLPEITSLSERFLLPVDCVELKPLTYEERLQYLKASCCSGLRQSLLLSPKLKKLVKLTGGIFSQVENFQHQYAKEIICTEKTLGKGWGQRNKVYYGVMAILVLLLSYIGLQNNVLDLLLMQNVVTSSKDINTTESKLHSITQDLSAGVNESKSILLTKKLDEEPVDIILEDILNQAELIVEPSSDDRQSLAIMSGEITETKEVEEVANTDQTYFQQRLAATRLWLDSVDGKLASIQIMTIGFDQQLPQSPGLDKQLQQSLNRYLQKLQLKSIDLEAIKIYPLSKANKQMYGVLYGEFDSFNLASRAIKLLPDILKANQPFPRTVKGIRDEMNEF